MLNWQPSLDERYTRMSPDEAAQRIEARRKALGDSLVILGHHYQTDRVIRHADLTGDSLKLSQQAAAVVSDPSRSKRPEHIIFCGVHFMAETADMLTPSDVEVILPDLSAGCSMADMASYDDTVEAWNDIHQTLEKLGWTGRIIPITYVNSSAAIKAFVGEHGGACCTSSNADRVFAWAAAGGDLPSQQGEDIKILFLPDQHLGRNTAHAFGIDVETRSVLYDPKLTNKGEPLGGIEPDALLESAVILWAGHCSVHKLFRPEHCGEILSANQTDPDNATRILVHPECAKEVVDKAHDAGSTEYIIKQIEAAEPGSRWAIGTEVHLVNRLAQRAAQRGVHVRILSDCQCLCTTMYRIDEPHLLWVLDGLCGLDVEEKPAKHQVRNVIQVRQEVREHALAALDRMLSLATPTAATTD
ncbi:MAG: quinolinate synthase NadA [Planctomycetota bacterium]